MHERITSVGNRRVKEVLRLASARRRDRQGLMIVEGQRPLERAFQAGIVIRQLYRCEELLPDRARRELAARLSESAGEVIEVAPHVMEKLAYRKDPDGLLAIADHPQRALADLPAGFNPLLLVTENLEKPGNLGAILRSADGAGVDGVIVCDRRTDIYHPNAITASTGTVFTVPIAEAQAETATEYLAARGIAIVAATPEADLVYSDVDLTVPTALVVGSEHLGLGEPFRRAATVQVAIPMSGVADSLNVAATATVLLFEAARQRRRAKKA